MKKLIQSLRERLQLLGPHKVSFGILAAVTLFIFADNLCDFTLIKDHELLFLILAGILAFPGTFLSELLFSDKRKWIGIGTAVTAAVVFSLLLRPFLFRADLHTAFTSARILYASAGYGLILSLLVLFFSWKNSGEEFRAFAGKVFRNCVLVAAACGIIFILVLVLVLIVAVLFGEFSDKTLSSAAILLLGLLAVPGVMAALLRPETEPGKFFGMMIRAVFPAFQIAAVVIGYLYMARLAAFRYLPRNSIFGVITVLFMICFVIWMIDDPDSGKKNFFSVVRRWLPVAFLPLFLLQSFALFLRIRQYGFTPWRYMGLALLVFELAVILFLWFRPKKLQILVLILAGEIAFVTLLPFVNIPSVARWSANRVWAGNYREDAEIDWNPEGGTGEYTWFSLYASDLAPTIPLSGFDTMRSFTLDREALGEYDYEKGYQVDYSAVPVIFTDSQEKAELDLSRFITEAQEYVRTHQDTDDETRNEYLRTLNPAASWKGNCVYLTGLEFSIQQDLLDGDISREVISQFEITGVWLFGGQE